MRSESRVLTCVYWDVEGVLLVDYLEKGPTIYNLDLEKCFSKQGLTLATPAPNPTLESFIPHKLCSLIRLHHKNDLGCKIQRRGCMRCFGFGKEHTGL